MLKYVTGGTIAAVLSVAAIIAGAFGKTALAAFFSDPSTAQGVLAVIGSAGTLVAGLLNGVKPTNVTTVEVTSTPAEEAPKAP